jgi:hypothetical protein
MRLPPFPKAAAPAAATSINVSISKRFAQVIDCLFEREVTAEDVGGAVQGRAEPVRPRLGPLAQPTR